MALEKKGLTSGWLLSLLRAQRGQGNILLESLLEAPRLETLCPRTRCLSHLCCRAAEDGGAPCPRLSGQSSSLASVYSALQGPEGRCPTMMLKEDWGLLWKEGR